MSADETRAILRALTHEPVTGPVSELRQRVAAVQSEYDRGALRDLSREEIAAALSAVDAMRRQRGDSGAMQAGGAGVVLAGIGSIAVPLLVAAGLHALLEVLFLLPVAGLASAAGLRGVQNRAAAAELATLVSSLRKECESRERKGGGG